VTIITLQMFNQTSVEVIFSKKVWLKFTQIFTIQVHIRSFSQQWNMRCFDLQLQAAPALLAQTTHFWTGEWQHNISTGWQYWPC
jgi:hypothetical protein